MKADVILLLFSQPASTGILCESQLRCSYTHTNLRMTMAESAETEVKSTPTELLHLTYEGNFQLECNATVLHCRTVQTNRPEEEEEEYEGDETKNSPVGVEIELDQTTMHPQGGGQPTDIGTISVSNDTNNSTISIEKVTVDRDTGIVTHFGTADKTTLSPLLETGTCVQVSVDPDQRQILSECHTAGHVVDSAMARCNRMLPPSKGYHFLDGPYVE